MPQEQDGQPLVWQESQLVSLLEKAVAVIRARSRLPESSYRLQFHAGFTFRDARLLVPYLHDLGITDCYASPYLKARPGSRHGYDISDHQALNPEVGSASEYEAWVQALHDHGMGQILDVVPNHMGILGNENAWWNDVLENGPSSSYAGFFDIDWYPVKPDLREKVLLGVLGDPYGKALEAQEISLSYERGAFAVHYYEHRFPVSPESSLLCLQHRLEELEQALGKESTEFMEYRSILTALGHLPPRAETEKTKTEERGREKEVIKRRLAALTESCSAVGQFIQRNVTIFNGNRGDPHSFDLLDRLLEDQAYRLAFWRVAADEINYRRFFDVNDLAALSMEKPEVFAATHSLILRLLAEGKITGLRIDHLDGLYDPKQYLERLQEHFVLEQVRQLAAPLPEFQEVEWQQGAEALLQKIRAKNLAGDRLVYVVAEKILGKDEPIPEHWLLHGTTGYEFLKMLNGLFVDTSQEALVSRIYHRWTDMDPLFREYVYQNKFLTLQVSLSSELHMLAHQLDRLSDKHRWFRDFTLNSLRHALREIIACFPVYRSYITAEVLPRDRRHVEVAVHDAKQKNPAISSSIFDFIRDMLLLHYPETAGDDGRAEQRRFVGKFQQVTGPVMAKGLEDTSFYVYNRLLSLNEVGGDPGRFGVAPAALHEFNQDRQRLWPHALSATSTHDTKRSEDVRARLNILSELPRQWQKCLSRWKRRNKRHRVALESLDAPDRNDEYLLYQTLIGAWPLGPPPIPADFVARMQQYMAKAIREAKVHSSWINPNPAYDEAVCQFVARILDEKISRRFLNEFRAFQALVSHLGLFNSLSQTLLKIASPGVADFYQGTELWDFSLVDPDNRRPVDYTPRQRLLKELKNTLAARGERREARDEKESPLSSLAPRPSPLTRGERREARDEKESPLSSLAPRPSPLTPLLALARELVETKEDGRIKLFVTYQGLGCRRDHPGLFTRGQYLAAAPLGARAENVFACVRRQESQWAVAAVPRLVARLMSTIGDLPLGAQVWQDGVLLLPGIRPQQRCRNIFTGETLQVDEHDGQAALPLAAVFANFPVALLMGQAD
jgi:(1->4)-alpha-D-glucan 1-alpha-D-glucosylmutase